MLSNQLHMSETYQIIKQTIDELREDTNLASDACRGDIARTIADRVDEHICKLIEDIVSPCVIPKRS